MQLQTFTSNNEVTAKALKGVKCSILTRIFDFQI